MGLERLEPRLLNPQGGDPGLYVELTGLGRALLLDLGENPLSAAELLRARDLFVSHAHVDHWIGFDRLVRTCLGQERTLRVFGPEGMADRVGHRLHGYTWNLTFDVHVRIVVHELVPESEAFEVTEYSLEDRFSRPRPRGRAAADGVALRDAGFSVEYASLDHGTPCLGYAVVQPPRYSFDPARLEAAGVAPGPHLSEQKAAFLRGEDPEEAARLGRFLPEVRIAYVTDTVFSPAVVEEVRRLARDADVLYCEATYPDSLAQKAAEHHHLTGGQCGALARAAGARSLVVTHISRRYGSDPGEVLDDVERGRSGEVDWLSRL